MRIGSHSAPFTAALLCFVAAACSGGGSDDPVNSIQEVVQDLTLDPTGATTVVTFANGAGLGLAGSANFQSDGGQTATGVVVVDDTVTITWDDFVPPSDRVRAFGLTGVSSAYADVTTSDASAPTFSVTDGVQNTGLGGDVVEVTFAGTHVVEALAEDPATWTLRVNGTALDLAGSSFDLDPDTQVLTVTLGASANLHATFTLAASGLKGVNDADVSGTAVNGAASGDTTAPNLVSAEQNLSEDEYGRVVDFTFDEAMDPVFATGLAHFTLPDPDVAVSVEQVAPETLRVAFNNPVVPGVDDVTLVGLVDAHGNALADGPTAVTQSAPVANAYDGTPLATTVQDEGGDTLTVVTTQALDPDTAVDPASWTLTIAGNPVDLSLQTLGYDLLSKTLTIELAFDMTNGDAFQIDGVAALDVDGETFTASASGNAAGDATAPTVTTITQNRNVDPSGKTVDVQFSEDLEQSSAENTANYVEASSATLVSATLLSGLDAVRLVYDEVVVPGDFTFTVSGVDDLAGNTMVAQPGVAFGSTDADDPAPSNVTAEAVAGADNDTLTVVFDDDMVESEITDPANWTVESPIGASFSTAGCSVVWESSSKTAVLTFDNGGDLLSGADFQVTFANARDIGGNTVVSLPWTGDVQAESELPEVHTVVRDAVALGTLHVRFTEPCAELDDLYDAGTNPTGTRYVLRDSGGTVRALPLAATPVDDGLGADVDFGVTVGLTDTLDVLGATDRTGNPLVPSLLTPIQAQDATDPALNAGATFLVAISGENNDEVLVAFDRPMSPWTITDPAHYTVTGPAGVLSYTGATFEFDGLSTVTIRLRNATGSNLETGGSYDVSVDGVWSAHGTQRTTPDSALGLTGIGDAVAPTVAVGDVRLDPQDANSLLIFTDETVDPTASGAATYDLGGGNVATSAQRISSRAIRATFGTPPVQGDTLTFDVTDLAGNTSGSISRAVAAADSAAPLITSVAGVVVPGYGNDYVDVSFDEAVTGPALDASSWTLDVNGNNVPLSGGRIVYQGAGHTTRLYLPPGVDLDGTGTVTVTIAGATDLSGNVSGTPLNAAGAVSGDAQAPSIEAAFFDWRADPAGTTLVVTFDEDVDVVAAGNPLSWSTSAGGSVTAVETIGRDQVRLTLSAALPAAATLSIPGLEDVAQNAAALLVVDPVE